MKKICVLCMAPGASSGFGKHQIKLAVEFFLLLSWFRKLNISYIYALRFRPAQDR